MRLFIWRVLENVSLNYHKRGGLVIVAAGIGEAMTMATTVKEEHWSGKVSRPIVIDRDPDAIYDVGECEPAMYVFPDAGCC